MLVGSRARVLLRSLLHRFEKAFGGSYNYAITILRIASVSPVRPFFLLGSLSCPAAPRNRGCYLFGLLHDLNLANLLCFFKLKIHLRQPTWQNAIMTEKERKDRLKRGRQALLAMNRSSRERGIRMTSDEIQDIIDDVRQQQRTPTRARRNPPRR